MNFLNYFFLIFNLITISITQPNVDFYNTGVNNYENHQIPTNIVSSYNTYSTNQNPSVYPEIREYDFSKLFQNSNFNTIPSSASSYYSSSPQGNNKNSFAETNTIEDLPSINTANLASQDPNVLAQYLKYVESVHNVENDNLKGISSQNPYLSTLLQGNSQVNLPEQPLTQYATNLKIPESAYQTSNVLPSSGYSVSSQSNVNFPSSSSYTLPNSYSQQEKMTYISPSSEKLPSDYSKNTKTSYNMEYNIQPGYNGYSVNQPTPVNNPSIYSGQETNSRQVVSSNLPYQNTVNSPYTIPQGYVNQPSIVPSSYSETPSTVQKPYEIPNTINGYTNNKVSQPTSLYTSNGQYNINNEVSSYTSSNVPVGLPPAPKTYTYVPPQKPTAAPQVQITPAPIYPSNKYSINPSNYNVPVASQSTNYNYQNIGIRQPTNVQPVVYPNNNAYTNIQSTNNQQINNGYPQAIQQPTQQIIQTTQSPIQIQTSLPIKETNIYNMESSLYNTKDTNINQGYSNNVVSNYVKSTEKEDNFYVPDDQKSIYENVEEDNYEKTNSLPSQGSSYRNSSEVSENNNDISSQTSIAALTQQIKRLPAVFYADSTDSNTQRIEHMLRDTYGLPLVTFYLDKIDDTNTVEKNLQTLTAHTGSPYLFICGTFIGSQQHIDNYNDNKQIPQLVEYVCGDQKHRHRSKRHDTTVSFPKVEWKKISSK
ncbi:Thioredoxin-like fold domain-containing protein [Strongyloides ratti]|uniref:Thioredoxin-like fold domain-containing protein n=1 Tax=Strongyloides ratti TaxID=34506 RepID=A0A090LBN1_STRRB|nr:Thioredoxin-like fold domain-containing protein [Strongyloides ratti]CEF67147.1 Thioredoxin-like fold domain-containing protein [Strongyloides ratti]